MCGVEVSKPASSYFHDLVYTPSKPSSRHAKNARVTFSQILKKSIEKDLNAKGFCHNCRGYKMLSSRRVTHHLPIVLTLLAGNINEEHRRLWATPGWLPEEIGIIVANGEFFCYEGDELKSLLDRQQRGQFQHRMMVYSLTAIAIDIDTGHKETHLVTMANGTNPPFVFCALLRLIGFIVAHSADEPPGKSQWHLFNDFHVVPVAREEALTFNASWKLPAVLTFQLKDANNTIDHSWRDKLDTSVLYYDPK